MITISLSLFCIGCSTLPKEHLQTFQEAQNAFETGNFRQAATQYQRLIDQNVKNGAVYYNLGNTWAKLDEQSKAVAAYYLAKRYIPNDPHLVSNLHTVLANNGGVMPTDDSLVGSIFFWQDRIGEQTKLWISLTLGLLTFFCGLASGVWQNRQVRRLFFGLTVFTLIAAVSAGYDWYRFEYLDQVIIAANEAVPRKGYSEQYEPAFVSPILFGTPAILLDERSGWYCLRFPGGREGWLPASQTLRL